MATANQVKALIRSHAEGDEARFFAVAIQVAAQEARNGHSKFAQELRDLVDAAKAKGSVPASTPRGAPAGLVQPRGELAGMLTASHPKARLADMALDRSVRGRIERVLLEQRQEERIRHHGFAPLRRLLLVGPPGTGKTMTAAVLASELGLPLFSIQLDGLITKFMGETAAKLRLIFDAIQQSRAVYLFDEFDALGGERASRNDVGEIRRVLNSFLQFLEHDESCSLVICATNHPKLLDHALFRRFDAVIEFCLPSKGVTERLMKSRLAPLSTRNVNWRAACRAAEGLSHGEVVRACEHAAKNAILRRSTVVETSALLEAMKDRRAAQA